ncbi:MAG TPA: Shedu anti-phage system protein SduA domain-containing protein [Gammaproteobacteria bacterium]
MSEHIYPNEFKEWLDSQSGERGALEFFAARPQILYWTFCRAGGHCRFLFKEFPLGSQYKADFVILNSYSGVWEVMFIEMEPVDDNVFTQNGIPSRRLAGAVKQVDDWSEYFDMHKNQVRAELVRWAKSKDLLGYSTDNVISNMSGDYLSDPESYLKDSFHIVIGRRENISRASHKRKATYTSKHGIEIVSYDRIKDLVDVRYQNTEPYMHEKS